MHDECKETKMSTENTNTEVKEDYALIKLELKGNELQTQLNGKGLELSGMIAQAMTEDEDFALMIVIGMQMYQHQLQSSPIDLLTKED